MAARPRTLPAAIAPVLVGTAAAVEQRGRPAARRRLRRRADRLDLHPDRHQPRQRLLRRQARRRHRRPARARCGSPPPGLVAPRRVLVATWLAFGVAVAAGIYLATVAGLGDPRRRRRSRSPPASSTPAARGPTATRASARSSSSSSSAWSPSTAPTTCSSSSSTGCRSGSRSRSASSRPRSSSSTTSATSRPTAAPASGRSRCGSGRERTRRPLRRRWSSAPSSSLPIAPGRRRRAVLGAARPARAAARACGPLRAVLTRTDGPALNGALAGTGALLGVFSLLVSRRAADRRLSAGSIAVRLDGRGHPLRAAVREPYVTARGELERREMVLVRLRDEDGLDGLGRSGAAGAARRRRARRRSPPRSASAAGRRCSDGEIEPTRIWSAIARCRDRGAVAAGACAAVDIALLDLAGKAAGEPRLAAARRRATPRRCAATRPWPPASPAAVAERRRALGGARAFDTFKLKVGLPATTSTQVRGGPRGARARGADPGRRQRRLGRRRGGRRA